MFRKKMAEKLQKYAETVSGEWRWEALKRVGWIFWDLDQTGRTVQIYEVILKECRETEFESDIKQYLTYYRAWHGHKPGQPVMPFTAETLSGDTIDLETFKGSVVILDFWSLHFGSGLEDASYVKQQYEKGHVEIIGICDGSDVEEIKEYSEENGLDWPQISDELRNKPLFEQYKIWYPYVFIIGRDWKYAERLKKGKNVQIKLKLLLREQGSGK